MGESLLHPPVDWIDAPKPLVHRVAKQRHLHPPSLGLDLFQTDTFQPGGSGGGSRSHSLPLRRSNRQTHKREEKRGSVLL